MLGRVLQINCQHGPIRGSCLFCQNLCSLPGYFDQYYSFFFIPHGSCHAFQRALFLEKDDAMAKAHSLVASAGVTEVLPYYFPCVCELGLKLETGRH